jgi:hypothetical protein
MFFAEHIEASELFEEGFHHVLLNKKNPKETAYCSVEVGHQNPILMVNL